MPNQSTTYSVNYEVRPTKAAVKQGLKLPITSVQRLEIIRDVQLLKHWSENEDNYDYQSAFGALEFKFDLPGKRWIRVIIFQDDIRRVMWVVRVFAKKTNQIEKVHQIGIESAVTQIKAEVRKFEKEQKYMNVKNRIEVITGDKK